MNIVWIFCAVLLQDCIGDVLPTEDHEEINAPLDWVDDLIEYIQNTTTGQQVTLVTNLKKNETMRTGPSIKKLFMRIVETFYTLQINVEGFNETQEWVLNHGKQDATFFDTSNAFFIFVHYSGKRFDTPSARMTVDAITEISAAKLTAQFLLVLVSQNFTESLEDFLKYAWSHKLLDFTIVEFVETLTYYSPIRADYEDVAPIIHQFNPFKKEYSRTNWTTNTEWFPDKLMDMWGYPLKVGVVHKPPFSITTFDGFKDPVYVGGANIDFLKIVAKTINFTMDYLPDIMKSSEITRSKVPDNLFDLMRSGKVDLLANLSPHFTETMKEVSLRTTPVLLTKLCTVIPILPRVAMPFSLEFFEAYVLYFGIVVVFWFASYMLKFKSQCWYPFNITRTVIGMSSADDPTRISERTLYACLLLVSAIFLTSMYNAMTSLSLQTNAEMEISTFHDLDVLDLRPQITRYFFNKTFAFDDDLIKLRAKAVIRPDKIIPICTNAAVRFKNTSCLLMKEEAMMVVEQTKHRGNPLLKATEPCFWSDSTAFLVGKRSPYRARIDNVITLMKDTGLVKKCYIDAISSPQSDQGHKPNGPDDNGDNSGLDAKANMKSLRQQLYCIVIIGYALSMLAFVGEILVDRVVKLRSKNRTKA